VSVDAASLLHRLDAIEARLKTAEARGSRSAVVPMNGGTISGNAYSLNDLDSRMGDLERQMGQMNGADERLQYAITQLAKRFDDYVKDIDLRLSDLEARTTRPAVPVALVQPPAAPLAAAPVAVAAVATSPAALPVTAVAAGTAPVATPAGVSASQKLAVPAKMNATDLYNKAYAFLSATDYENARTWLEEFLKRYPTDKLADNAWYWLGEVQLVQNNPSGAVVSFRNGLKYFPKGVKAPANLYKMGVALEQLKQPQLARGAWEKLMQDYPKSPEAARGKEKLLGLKPE
jgi:tol-pal system protein YbgF